jgi:hypothetical protein
MKLATATQEMVSLQVHTVSKKAAVRFGLLSEAGVERERA